MARGSPWSSLSDAQRAAAFAALVAEGRDVTWLDGGAASRGIVAFDADEVIESDDPRAIAAIDARWRREPGSVWTGCISYDFAADLVLGRRPRSRALPGIVLRRSRSWIEGGPEGVRVFGAPPDPPAGLAVPGPWPLGPLASIWSPETYRAKVALAQGHIVAGDTYQVNLAQRFFAPWR